MKKLARYRLKINPETGALVDFISIVDQPAIERNFLKFEEDLVIEPGPTETQDEFISRCISYEVKSGKEQDQAVAICYSKWDRKDKMEKLSSNDEKMELLGPVLIPNKPIYRRSPILGEYEIVFYEEDIKEIQMEFMKRGFQHNINMDHTDTPAETFVFGFFQSSDLIPNPKGFEDLPLGTLYAQMKVMDETRWEEIKKRGGFSIEGIFDYITEEFEKAYLEKNQTTTNIVSVEKLKLETMIKDLFRKIFQELSQELEEKPEAPEVETPEVADPEEKPEEVETEEELSQTEHLEVKMMTTESVKIETREVGAKVEMVGEDGSLVALPDGDYKLEDDFQFTVLNGQISKIEGQEEPEMEEPEVEEEPEGEDSNYQAQIDELKGEINSLKEMISGMVSQESMKAEFESIKEEFKAVFTKFKQIPSQESKVNQTNLAREESKRKFEEFVATIGGKNRKTTNK